jgi:hypothetical protein
MTSMQLVLTKLVMSAMMRTNLVSLINIRFRCGGGRTTSQSFEWTGDAGSQCPVDMQVSNPAYQASWRRFLYGGSDVTTALLISRSPVISKKTVLPASYRPLCTNRFLVVRNY